jgi:hypothetical protein
LVYDRFRLHHVVKTRDLAGYRTMTVNNDDSLYFESEAQAQSPHMYDSNGDGIAALKK